MSMRDSTFAINLERLLQEKGITQAKLSEEIGTTQSVISAYVRGTKPKIDMAIKIADYFGVSIYDMVKLPPVDLTANG